MLREWGLTGLCLLASCSGSDGDGIAPGVACGPYPAQATSPYVLPFQVGLAFSVGQGNCTSGSHRAGGATPHAYDFLMPIGTPVVAAREGTVLLVEERFVDGDHTPGHENFINVTQPDGTIAGYVHLTRDGALVTVGDLVRQGDVIGISGDTGNSTAPHLHFHVQLCAGCTTAAVVFRNTRPHPFGLVQGESYLAEPL